MKLSELLERYEQQNLNISTRSIINYWCVVNEFARWLKRTPTLADLNEATLLNWLRASMASRAARTVNNRRQVLLTLWRFAKWKRWLRRELPRVPKVIEPEYIPRAWFIEEIEIILDACKSARPIEGWDETRWRALVLVIYDTSHRIGALLLADRCQVSPDGWLTMYAWQTKQRADTVHRLHAETIEAIDAMPPSDKLFPWPLHKRAIWLEFGAILKAAGLPRGPRDKFHKIRRTSASYVARELGEGAAMAHLGHKTPGLAKRSYLDPRIVGLQPAIDALPRPKAG